jgi:hypothetical protein
MTPLQYFRRCASYLRVANVLNDLAVGLAFHLFGEAALR